MLTGAESSKKIKLLAELIIFAKTYLILLKLFRKNTLTANLILLILLALTHMHGFLKSTDMMNAESGSPAYDAFTDSFTGQETLARIMYILFLFIFSVNLNRITGIFKLTNINTAFPGYFFILLSSLSSYFLLPNPIIFGSFFIIVSLMYLFRTESPNSSNANLYNAGFFCAIGSLIYAPLFYFVFTILLSYLYLKKWSIRTFAQFVLAFFTPFFLLSVYYITILKDEKVLIQWLTQPFHFVSTFGNINWQAFIPMSVFLLVLIIHLINFNTYQQKKNVLVKRKFGIWYLAMLSSGLFILTQPIIEWTDVLILVPFLGLLMGVFIGEMKNKLIAELLNLFLLSTLLFLHYYLNS